MHGAKALFLIKWLALGIRFLELLENFGKLGKFLEGFGNIPGISEYAEIILEVCGEWYKKASLIGLTVVNYPASSITTREITQHIPNLFTTRHDYDDARKRNAHFGTITII